jgi:hypothetical protein
MTEINSKDYESNIASSMTVKMLIAYLMLYLVYFALKIIRFFYYHSRAHNVTESRTRLSKGSSYAYGKEKKTDKL